VWSDHLPGEKLEFGGMEFDGIARVVFGGIVFALAAFVYFLPTIVAGFRHHPNTTSIFILNFFCGLPFVNNLYHGFPFVLNGLFGGSIVGYVVSLAWAFIAIDHGDADIKPRRRSRF